MLNTFIAAAVGIVSGNYLLECVIIPIWFGHTANVSMAGERSLLMVGSIIIIGASLKLMKQWK
jgi:hypothetical protein